MARRFTTVLVLLAAAIALIVVLGPRTPVDTTIRFDGAGIGDDLDQWLAEREEAAGGVHAGMEKEIVWADPATRSRTPLSIVYVHGFSATKHEVRPLPDKVAAALGANLFFTRLAGHGMDGEELAGVTVNAWVDDMAEAMAIGRRIGEKVIVIATSTGGGLATWAAAQPDLAEDMKGLALISPNYAVRASGSWILTMPWGGTLAERILGPERSWEPQNEMHGRYWTTRYPTRALLPMAALTELAGKTQVETIAVPALFIYSPDDQVVDATVTADLAKRWGASVETVLVTDAGDTSNHVIAGDALSPGTTDELADATIAWIRALP